MQDIMNPSEGLKRLLYERFLHFAHLMENNLRDEIEELVYLAQLEGITSCPNNMTSIHVIDCIGKNEPINNTSIAEKMNLSKASISKISTHLIKEGYIKRSQMNDNKKEVYFYLSSKGKQIFEVHAIMHEMIERRFISVFDSFSDSELQASLKFFQTVIDQRDNILKGNEKVWWMYISRRYGHILWEKLRNNHVHCQVLNLLLSLIRIDITRTFYQKKKRIWKLYMVQIRFFKSTI